MPGASININNIYWNKTQTNDATATFVLEISYGGVVYATINSTFGDTPTVEGNNGATVNINTLPPVTGAPPIAGILSAKTNLIITLPYNISNSSGTLLFTFTAGTSSNNVRDLGMQSVSLLSCKDTDGDGTPDYLDLDSDGDGCPDAIEGAGNFTSLQLTAASGALSSQSPNLNFGTTVDVNNGIPTVVGVTGQGVGQSQDASKNDCIDTDADGVPDWTDIDDDNDGILDAEESPDCFYSITEIKSMITSISSQFPGDDFTLLYNDVAETTAAEGFNFTTAQTTATNAVGSNLLTIKFNEPVELSSLSLTNNISSTAAARAQLFGSNDNVTFLQLSTTSGGVNINTSTGATFTVAQNAGKYRYYKIQTTVAGAIAITDVIGEINFILTANYNPSEHPKSSSCIGDTDGDGTPNHLDTDSDGDGCSDAYEGGATTSSSVSVIPGPYGANGLANSLETSSESGVVNYISTYRKYATKSSQKLCVDSDNDGVSNPIDIDDDNDGVLDTQEGDFCGRLDRNIRVGYINTTVGSTGLATNLLYNLNNFGTNGVYNKVRGVTLIPFTNSAAVTEASLLAQNIDVFYVGSSAENATTTSDKIPTSANSILATWAKNNGKGIFALQNNAVDYGYTLTSNNTNPDSPVGVLGRDYYTNGYWPTAALSQTGTVQMTIKSNTRPFDFLMLDANFKPVVIADREYNLVIFPDATIYINEAGNATPTTDDQKAIADTWAYVFDKYLDTQCTWLDTDGDGTPNQLDLDSDNDGCSDAIESGATNNFTTDFAFVTQAGTATDTNSDGLADIVDANKNGIPDYLSTYDPQAINNTIKICIDNDGDGYPDYQ